MTISIDDAILIARGLGICYQMHVPSEQILAKTDEQVRHLICVLKGEGVRVEMLGCFREFFPDGLTVTRPDEPNGPNGLRLPVVSIGAG